MWSPPSSSASHKSVCQHPPPPSPARKWHCVSAVSAQAWQGFALLPPSKANLLRTHARTGAAYWIVRLEATFARFGSDNKVSRYQGICTKDGLPVTAMGHKLKVDAAVAVMKPFVACLNLVACPRIGLDPRHLYEHGAAEVGLGCAVCAKGHGAACACFR